MGMNFSIINHLNNIFKLVAFVISYDNFYLLPDFNFILEQIFQNNFDLNKLIHYQYLIN